MNIALVGYGKMGHIIHKCAEDLKHNVVATVDTISKDATVIIKNADGESLSRAIKEANPDGIIEFSHPTAVLQNIRTLLPLGIPIVVGTTGWHNMEEEVAKLAKEVGGVIMTSSNFSIGVNMFYKVVAEATRLFEQFSEYDIATSEIHHNQKADSPSGTALEIAKTILDNTKKKSSIVTDAFHQKPESCQLHVASVRVGSVPGTHTVYFDSVADTIELTHRARSREGFALGAVHALERLCSKVNSGELCKGALYHMGDLF